jgi:hypothetical protein
MGGLRGCAPGGCAGAAHCGFATNEAKAYCEQLYQKALAVMSGQQTQASPVPPPPSASGGVGQTIGQFAQRGSEILGATATGLGHPPQPTTQSVLSYAVGFAPLILIGVVGLVIYAVVKSR